MDLAHWLPKIPVDLDYEIPTGSHGIVHIGKLCHDAGAEIERLRVALRPFAANFQIGAGYHRDDFQRASEAYGDIADQQGTKP